MSSPNYIVGLPRSPEQIEADRAFLAKARSRSPKFPDMATLRERRQQRNEKIAARGLLSLTAISLLAAPFVTTPGVALGIAAVCGVGFIATCFIAGNRLYVKAAGGSGGRPC